MNARLQHREITVEPSPDLRLDAFLSVPESPIGLVVFAHGSGSSRHSPRNTQVARHLHDAGLATLLFDLLTASEERVDRVTRELRFDIPMLADRLNGTVDWCRDHGPTADLPVGTFGASTGAAAALIAAAERPDAVHAVVSRGGRPDLARDALARVKAPVLLIVGGEDHAVIDLNEAAAAMLQAPHELKIIEGATHLFEEPGALDEVARLTAAFFRRHLGGG